MAQLGGKPIRVKLNVDLTRYDSRCVEGSLGKTIPGAKLSMYGDMDHFVAVQFDNGAKLDVLWKSLLMGKKFNKPAGNF